MRVATLEDLRPFRLVADDVMARVDADHHVSWDLSVVAERVVPPGASVSENLAALLQRSPEAMWLKRAGMTITLVESALLAGAECPVAGSARRTRPYAVAAEA